MREKTSGGGGMADSIQQQTLALLGQEFLTQALLSGGSLNSAMAEMLLSARSAQKNGRETAAAALTGRIRGDSVVMRQGAKNAAEAAIMADMARPATLSLAETLNEMQTLVQSVRSDPSSAADADVLYQSLASQLAATVEGTRYNGISLLDGTGWANDERLAVSGGTATISIQVGKTGTNLTLRDVSVLKNFSSSYPDLAQLSAGDLDILAENIAKSIGTVSTMASGYQSLAGSFTGQARYLEQQADNLALAAQNARPGGLLPDFGDTESSLKSLITEILLRDQGKLVDTSS